jgi:hypothetical protein
VDDRSLDRLARRIRWLEDHRRTIAVACGFAVSIYLFFFLRPMLGTEWPLFHARLMAVIAYPVTTFFVEVVIAWPLAWWEVKHGVVTRARRLPRAIVLEREPRQ